MLDAFDAPYMQRAAAEVLLLSIPGGLLGTWIVLRRLAFFTHAAGTAALPGLVVAGPWGLPPQLAALCASLAFGSATGALSRIRRVATDAATGLALVAALAIGVVLANDVYESGGAIDRLLFGSLLAVDGRDLAVTAAVAAGVLVLDAAMRRSWLAQGFDPEAADALGVGGRAADRLLLLAIAAAVVVALDAVGALLVSAVFVVPAATVRLVAPTVRALRAGAVALAAAEGLAALALAQALDVGPGAAMATLGGAVFLVVALVTRLRGRIA